MVIHGYPFRRRRLNLWRESPYGETKDDKRSKPKGGVGKSTTAHNQGAGLAIDGKKILMLDVDPQGDLTTMLGQCRPRDLPLTLANAMSDVVAGTEPADHPEVMHHHGGFDFVPGNRSLSAVEVNLVNVMSRETVLRQCVDSVKRNYDYMLLDCHPSLCILGYPVRQDGVIGADFVMTSNPAVLTWDKEIERCTTCDWQMILSAYICWMLGIPSKNLFSSLP